MNWWESLPDASPMDAALQAEGVTGRMADIARSIYHQESGSGRNTTTSNAGAVGGMQIIPATFASVADKGWDIRDPVQNARAGVRYVAKLYEMADGDPALTAAGYYGGPGGMEKARRGIAVSDPRNPNAPTTLQYGQQVAARLPKQEANPVLAAVGRGVSALIPSAQAGEVPKGGNWWDAYPDAPQQTQQTPKQTPAQAPAQAAAPNPTDGMNTGETILAGAGRMLTQGARGLKQNLLDEPAAALERLMPWSAGVSKAIGGKTAAEIADEARAQAAEAKRLDAPLRDTKAGFAGDMLAGAAVAPLLAPFGAMGGGMMFGAAEPTTEGGGEALKNMAIGAGAGYVGDKLVKGAARVIQPVVNPLVKRLQAEGITPTMGQILGGNWAKLEAKSTSLPIMGDAIANAQRRAGAEVIEAGFNRALAPIGGKLPKDLTGHEAVSYTKRALGKAYEDLLPKLNGTRMDAAFEQEIGSLRQMMQDSAIDPKYTALFERTIDARVLGKFQGQKAINGQTLKDVETHLGNEVERFGKAQDPDARLIGDAFKEVQSSIRGLVERTNPLYAKQLKNVNTGYANYKRMERAATSVAADGGEATPAMLHNAVKALDRSKDKVAFGNGDALMQDLSGAAKEVMGSKYPDSGSIGRAANIGALAAGAINPAIPAGLAAGYGLYSAPAQKLVAGLLTARPAGAGLLSQQIESFAPYAGLLSAGGAMQLK